MLSTTTPVFIAAVIAIYFLLLSVVAYLTSRGANNETFFTANKESPWYLVAFGMIGASLSGVTFISLPGLVGAGGTNQSFAYMQMVMGYIVGYAIISQVLMPLYYKWNLKTIYSYLGKRLGLYSHKTASAFFLLSRAVGASLRLYLIAIILQKFVMDGFGIPFYLTVFITIALIWLYTFKGGIKTIVWTDTIQTAAMLLSVGLTLYLILDQLDISFGTLWQEFHAKEYNKVFFFDGGWSDPNNFYKQFISGALIALAMTGLDQDMMQKNLTCKNIGEAQKNMFWFSAILILANLMFLILGGALYVYAIQSGIEIPMKTDQLYPTLAYEHLPTFISVFFTIGLVAAAYSSADSALTSLTTSFCVDFLNFEKNPRSESDKKRIRIRVHVLFSVILYVIILIVYFLGLDGILNSVFKAAGYTYGPILGLFAFAILTKRKLKKVAAFQNTDMYVIFISLFSILVTYILDVNSQQWFWNFSFSSTIIALNAAITFICLYIVSEKR